MEHVIRTVDNFSFLKLVSFKDFSLWDVKRYLKDTDLSDFVELENILIPYKKVISREKILKDNVLIISKINFKGELFLRGFEELHTYKGTLFEVPPDHLIYSKINVRHGCVYFNLTGKSFAVSSEYPVYIVDEKKAIGEFIPMALRSSKIKDYLNTRNTGISKSRIKADEFVSTPIPLPNLSEQEEILAGYKAKMEETKRLTIQLEKFSEAYENTLFDFLGITKIPVKEVINSLQFINLINTSRWGYQYLLNHEQCERLLDTKKYPQKLLSSLVLLNPTTSFSELKKDDKISFLPMECVSDLYGEVIEYRDGDVRSSGGYTKFQEGDLLWSKITPCMQNGKSCIVENLENGFGYGSTEYHVIREKIDSEIDLRFLYHLLRTKYVLTNATFHFTGSAGQQRVPIEFLANLNIPLPSIDEQKEISNELDKLIADRKVKQVKVTELKEQAIKDFEAKIFKL